MHHLQPFLQPSTKIGPPIPNLITLVVVGISEAAIGDVRMAIEVVVGKAGPISEDLVTVKIREGITPGQRCRKVNNISVGCYPLHWSNTPHGPTMQNQITIRTDPICIQPNNMLFSPWLSSPIISPIADNGFNTQVIWIKWLPYPKHLTLWTFKIQTVQIGIWTPRQPRTFTSIQVLSSLLVIRAKIQIYQS